MHQFAATDRNKMALGLGGVGGPHQPSSGDTNEAMAAGGGAALTSDRVYRPNQFNNAPGPSAPG